MERLETPGARPRTPATRPAAHRRWLMLALGWIFFGLGLLGTVLPLLPTTPFMLLALWAFSTGSERFHAWLYHHPVFGPPLRRWREERVIPLWGKLVAITSMLASLGWAAFGAGAPWYGLLAMASLMAVGVAYIFRFPSKRAAPPRGPDGRPA